MENKQVVNTQPEVELDLDGVKETSVEIKEEVTKKEKPQTPNLNLGEVDLGYTTHAPKNAKEEKPSIEVQETEEKPEVKVKVEKKTEELSLLTRIEPLTNLLNRRAAIDDVVASSVDGADEVPLYIPNITFPPEPP